ncbi:AraC family transcriptional regulator [Staphylococcus kloosii]|jgi:AraC family transcriptional regulator|uniref:AraC family transcriptional regulator n=1 Tax=Staphylococcus kloosii TaxID=29384 RepID=UPI00189EA090|nr:AraC family transcriptional regulator [Staphylococcus kloosii]MBF7025536.1 AraC family transcriptional regulator [Staphylococcus kloosii]
MKDQGVLDNSYTNFYSPSKLASNALLYLIYAGEFFVNTKYIINRKNWDSYLIMYVISGEICIEYNNEEYVAKENTVLLLNCYEPHVYYASKDSHFKWFHFAGKSSHYYFNHIIETQGLKFSQIDKTIIVDTINQILDLSRKEPLQEERVSIQIYKLLYELNTLNGKYYKNHTNDVIYKAQEFMNSNYSSSIAIKDIANHVNLSDFHFCRLFKRVLGYTPKQYLREIRINKSKTLLQTTKKSISEISSNCGFNSETYFVTNFKKYTNMTPTEFRNIKF